jgi:hypothetical protein
MVDWTERCEIHKYGELTAFDISMLKNESAWELNDLIRCLSLYVEAGGYGS